MTRRAAIDAGTVPYAPGSAGTASDGFRVPEPRKPETTKEKR